VKQTTCKQDRVSSFVRDMMTVFPSRQRRDSVHAALNDVSNRQSKRWFSYLGLLSRPEVAAALEAVAYNVQPSVGIATILASPAWGVVAITSRQDYLRWNHGYRPYCEDATTAMQDIIDANTS
jgi:hypothetical protein